VRPQLYHKKCHVISNPVCLHGAILYFVTAANYVYAWIGAKYDHEHGEYRWVDNSPLNFTSWAPGLPGIIKGCVDYLHKYHYMWNAHTGCTETKGPFICQKGM
jgi:hypothetical protein